MPEYLSTFHQSLVDPDTFSITWELVPGRGAFERAQKTVLRSAEKAAKGGKVHVVSVAVLLKTVVEVASIYKHRNSGVWDVFIVWLVDIGHSISRYLFLRYRLYSCT